MENQIILNKENKNTIIKLIFSESLRIRDDYADDLKNFIDKIKNLKIFNFNICLCVNNIFINTNEFIDTLDGCNKKVLKIYVLDNSIYFYSDYIYLPRGFCYLLRDVNPNLFKIINRIINLESEQNKKILQYIAICNTLIKNNFRRPYNLTENIMSCY